jgi:LacI family transcriptional regulator
MSLTRTPGARPATLADVAALAGVTKDGASVVLNGARSNTKVSASKRELILQAARELNYQANPHAQRLASRGLDKTVGIFTLRVSCPTAIRKIGVVQDLLRDRGYDAPLHAYAIFNEHRPVNQVALMREICRSRPRAVVCHMSGLEPEAADELRHYQETGGIVVGFDETFTAGQMPQCQSFDQVIFDTGDNMYQGARHLASLGHRKIGLHIADPCKPSGERLQAFSRALAEVGEPVRDKWLFHAEGNAEESGDALALKYLSLPAKDRPTALCISNDFSASTFMVRAFRAGVSIPEDISIVAHDNSSIAPFCLVPLTAVSHCMETVGRCIVERLTERLAETSDSVPCHTTVQGELVVRESTALLPANHNAVLTVAGVVKASTALGIIRTARSVPRLAKSLSTSNARRSRN